MIAPINCPVCDGELTVYFADNYFNAHCNIYYGPYQYRHYRFIINTKVPAKEMTRFEINNDNFIIFSSHEGGGTTIYYVANEIQTEILDSYKYISPNINYVKRLLNLKVFL